MPLPNTSALHDIAHAGFPPTIKEIVARMLGAGAPFGSTIQMLERDGDDATPGPQDVRISHSAGGQRRESESAQEAIGGGVVIGATDLDVVVGDRFHHEDTLYRVLYVWPNRQAYTVATIEAVQ